MAVDQGKRNFLINTVGDTTTISILGGIGDLLFEDGYTMQDAKRDLQAVNTPKINLIVASQGGRLVDALVIHDLIKSNKAEVTSQILGATASSGTLIAQAADKGKVTMSVNAKHLIHNVMDLSVGNASEFRAKADELDKWDDTVVNIYTDRIGDKKTETELRNLLAKGEWQSAETAKEWGFVDEVFTPGKDLTAVDCYDCNLINAHEAFPNIDEAKPTAKPTEPAQPSNNGLMNTINDKLKNLLSAVNLKFGKTNVQPDPPATPDNGIQVMVQGLQADIQNVTTTNQVLTNKLSDLQIDRDKIFEDYKTLAVLHAHKTEIEEIDAIISANEDKEDSNKKYYEEYAAGLRED